MMNFTSCELLNDYEYLYSLTSKRNGSNPLPSLANLSRQLLNCKTGKLFAYWLISYPPIPNWIHYTVGSFMIFVMIIGVSGNVIAFWIFSSTKSLRTPSNLLLLNLVFSDSMILLSNCPLSIIAIFRKNWYLKDLGCNFYGFTGGLFGLLSINTIASIACDRAFVIVNSLKVKKINYKQAIFIIILIWSYCLFWCLLPLGAWSSYVFEGPLTSCTINYVSRDKSTISYALCLFIFCFLTPLSIITISYIIIFRTIFMKNKKITLQLNRNSASRHLVHPRGYALNIKIAKMSIYLLIGFLVAWGPYASLLVISLIGKTSIITPIVTLFPAMFAKTSAVYNPFIYAFTYQNYKKMISSEYIFYVIFLPLISIISVMSNFYFLRFAGYFEDVYPTGMCFVRFISILDMILGLISFLWPWLYNFSKYHGHSYSYNLYYVIYMSFYHPIIRSTISKTISFILLLFSIERYILVVKRNRFTLLKNREFVKFASLLSVAIGLFLSLPRISWYKISYNDMSDIVPYHVNRSINFQPLVMNLDDNKYDFPGSFSKRDSTREKTVTKRTVSQNIKAGSANYFGHQSPNNTLINTFLSFIIPKKKGGFKPIADYSTSSPQRMYFRRRKRPRHKLYDGNMLDALTTMLVYLLTSLFSIRNFNFVRMRRRVLDLTKESLKGQRISGAELRTEKRVSMFDESRRKTERVKSCYDVDALNNLRIMGQLNKAEDQETAPQGECMENNGAEVVRTPKRLINLIRRICGKKKKINVRLSIHGSINPAQLISDYDLMTNFGGLSPLGFILIPEAEIILTKLQIRIVFFKFVSTMPLLITTLVYFYFDPKSEATPKAIKPYITLIFSVIRVVNYLEYLSAAITAWIIILTLPEMMNKFKRYV